MKPARFADVDAASDAGDNLQDWVSDYNRARKIADLSKRLSIEGAPDGIDPAAGDIAHSAPEGSLAISFRDFSYWRALVCLDRLEGDIEPLERIEGDPS